MKRKELKSVFAADWALIVELQPVSDLVRVENVNARKPDKSFALFEVGHADAALKKQFGKKTFGALRFGGRVEALAFPPSGSNREKNLEKKNLEASSLLVPTLRAAEFKIQFNCYFMIKRTYPV